jgi:hypothetical protein
VIPHKASWLFILQRRRNREAGTNDAGV